MIVDKKDPDGLKNQWPQILLCISGALLNLVAVLTDGNGALVAVGCALIAIGAGLSRKKKKKAAP